MDKPWYKQWWGILIIVILSICVLFTLLFIVLVTRYYFQINKETKYLENFSKTSAIERTLVETSDDPSFGNPASSLVIVEFSDFTCEFCQKEFLILSEVMKKYANEIKLIYRDFPADGGTGLATSAALAANCAKEQNKFWEYHDLLFSKQQTMSEQQFMTFAKDLQLDEKRFKQCLNTKKYQTEIEDDLLDGLSAGISATPTFFINGIRIPGAISAEMWEKIITEPFFRRKEK